MNAAAMQLQRHGCGIHAVTSLVGSVSQLPKRLL
jgi:hypothetical protein